MVPIFMTSFFRKDMTERAVREIHERTAPGSFQLHLYDNGSSKETRDFLISLLEQKKITSLVLDSRNTGCNYNKSVFYAMTEYTDKYFCVTDNDVYPPKLTPDWLSQMVAIMDRHPELAVLAPQLPPQGLQMPYQTNGEIIYCKAVGNTLKLVRREAFPFQEFKPKLMEFGDDGLVCSYLEKKGWKTAFCTNIFCYHHGQCENWGYTKEQIDMDPRKAGYGGYFKYDIVNWDTYEPEPRWRITG